MLKLSRERILRAAVQLVDEHGLPALSMRRLGVALGVEAMSLYRHVANKADLLDGVHEAILGEMKLPPQRGGWMTRARALALAFHEVLAAHPNALPVFATRPAVTPASLAYVERGLAILGESGLPEREVVAAFQAIVAFVIGHTSLSLAPVDAPSPPAAVDPKAFPHLARHLAHLRAPSVADELRLGVELLLAGIAQRAA